MAVLSISQPSSPNDIAMSSLPPEGTRSRSPPIVADGEEEHKNGRRGDPISIIMPDDRKKGIAVAVEEANHRARQNSRTPTIANDHTGIYWRTPTEMVSFFLFGMVCCIVHHVYYSKRDGRQALSQVDQQWALRAGTTLAFLVVTSLVVSVRNAYTQWLWKTLKNKQMSIEALDAAFQADISAHAIANSEMFWKMPVGLLIAIIALSIPIAALITPTTLSIRQGEYYHNTTANVTSLDMSTVDPSQNINQPSRFAVSVPLYGQNSSNNASEVLTGPRTIISRLTDAAASTGNIPSIIPSYPNSTYILEFNGPKVECEDASPVIAGIIDNLIDSQMSTLEGVEQSQQVDYFGFVPIKNSSTVASNGTSPFPGFDVYPILGNRLEQPLNATNQLWMAYSIYGDGSNCQNPSTIVRKHTVCRLWSVSYTVNFTFENSIQNITVINYQPMNEVEYPIANASAPSNLTQHAYSAYMWALTNQIIGFMEIYTERLPNGTAGANYSQIQTPIQDTALLGSSDLDVYFDQRHLRLEGVPDCAPSDQRAQDIGLARNEPLDILIPELSFNVTMSYFSSNLLSPPVATNITTKTIVNFYFYNWRDLWISYGLAIAFALVANILGGVAFWTNNSSHERTFSALLSSTRYEKLRTIFNPETLGKSPLPKEVAKTPLIFEEMAGGGLSLLLVDAGGAAEEEPGADGLVGEEIAEDEEDRIDPSGPIT